MEARYYGYCPLGPGTLFKAERWFLSTGGHLVLLNFVGPDGVCWVGPEYPRDLAGFRPMETQTKTRTFKISATRIDAIQGWTEFVVEEAL